MTGYYDYTLVAASFVVAVLASYSALYFGAQLATLEQAKARLWLALGALTMGTGVWVMHFVGMQAYVMPMEMSYDLTITLISWVAAVGASGLALHIIGKDRAGPLQIVIGSLFMGGGITSMHYVGMAAMEMEPGMRYDPVLFSASVVIAVGASGVAMFICRRLQSVQGLKGTALQLGAAHGQGGYCVFSLVVGNLPMVGNLQVEHSELVFVGFTPCQFLDQMIRQAGPVGQSCGRIVQCFALDTPGFLQRLDFSVPALLDVIGGGKKSDQDQYATEQGQRGTQPITR